MVVDIIGSDEEDISGASLFELWKSFILFFNLFLQANFFYRNMFDLQHISSESFELSEHTLELRDQVFGSNFLDIWDNMLESAAVAAQYMLSGQQNQLASGQQPAGQEVSSGPHCLFLAIFMSWAFLATKGQSAAVAAQYMLSGQQNQLASGQQPAGQEVSSGPHCLFLAIFMSWA